jgi:hypothetical protein
MPVRRKNTASGTFSEDVLITWYVEFDVLRTMITKRLTFWDMTPCSLTEYGQYFGGTYCFNLQ